MGNNFFQKFLGKRKRITVESARVPDNTRIYVVGDIHGRADLLHRIHDLIREDAEAGASALHKEVIYLGDYIDRGLQSMEVIDFLLDTPLVGFESVYLKGNHEEQFLDFLGNLGAGNLWLRFGGDATVHNYGIRIPKNMEAETRLLHIQEGLRNSVPKRHLDFFSRLELTREVGDYFFVHAGINPYEPLKRQTPEDMLWIRSEFLESESSYGKVIVHGHTVTDAPDFRENRIGIDTGAYASGNLTCLVLEGGTKRFLTTNTKSR